MMGPASGGLQVFTLRRKAKKGVGYSGTPWSGHAVNWNWRTSRFSLEPFWEKETNRFNKVLFLVTKDKEWYKLQAQCNAESFWGDYNISGQAIKFVEPKISRTIKDLRHDKSQPHFGCLHAKREVWQRGGVRGEIISVPQALSPT